MDHMVSNHIAQVEHALFLGNNHDPNEFAVPPQPISANVASSDVQPFPFFQGASAQEHLSAKNVRTDFTTYQLGLPLMPQGLLVHLVAFSLLSRISSLCQSTDEGRRIVAVMKCSNCNFYTRYLPHEPAQIRPSRVAWLLITLLEVLDDIPGLEARHSASAP